MCKIKLTREQQINSDVHQVEIRMNELSKLLHAIAKCEPNSEEFARLSSETKAKASNIEYWCNIVIKSCQKPQNV